jgi:hypothetical protein
MPSPPLPRWLRVPVRWWLGNQMRAHAASLLCLHCSQPVGGSLSLPLSDALWDSVVKCDCCGHAMSVLSLMAVAGKTTEERIVEGVVPAAQPSTSRITVEQTIAGRTWHVPAAGGCSGLLAVGLICFLMSAICSVFVAWAWFNTGHRVDPLGVMWLMVLLALLLGAALWLCFTGLDRMRARHSITIGPVEFVHQRRLLGRTTRKSWRRDEVKSVHLVQFYTQDYKPVHGIEVRKGKNCIRFGSALDAMDKAWLCQQLRVALGLASAITPEQQAYGKSVMGRPFHPEPDPNGPMQLQVDQTGDGCTVTIPGGGSGGHVMIVLGVLMTGAAGFMLWRGLAMWMEGREKFSAAMDNSRDSFFLLWCSGVALGVVIGLALAWSGWRRLRTSQRIIASSDKVSVETRTGSKREEEAWDVAQVHDIGVEPAIVTTPHMKSGTFRGVIILEDRVHGFGAGYSRHDLECVAASLRSALGRDQPTS